MNGGALNNPGAEERIVRTACTHDCGGRCPLRAHVKDGVVTRVEAADGDGARYRACLRGRATRQRAYHPDRLKYPMRRVGERGEGKFERISWDEALDTVAGELKRVKETYGNSAIMAYMGGGSNGRLHGGRAMLRLLNMFGGCTWGWGNVSCAGAVIGGHVTYGTFLTGNTHDDHINSRLIIMWGWNPTDAIWDTETRRQLMEAKEAGVRFVGVDPRLTNSVAAYADKWIPIYPGTDTAMLVAMAHTIISEDLHDGKFIGRYTHGFEQYRDYVMGLENGVPKTAQWAEPITGVPAATIRGLAREYATSKPAALIDGWGPGRTAYGEQYHRAAMALAAITGNIGIRGGWAPGWGGGYPVLFIMESLPTFLNPLHDSGPKHRIPAYHVGSTTRVHSAELWDVILKGKAGGYPVDIKLMYHAGGNPLNQLSDTNKGVQALKKLEFYVVHEQFLTTSARFADIVLPVNTFLERDDIGAAWIGAPYFCYTNKCIESLYESKTDLQIITELAPRLGIEHFNDKKSDDEWLRELAATCKEIPDYDELKRRGYHTIELGEPFIAFRKQIEEPENNPFATPTGKIEIYSKMVEKLNDPQFPPIPKYIESWEGRNDPLFQKYPLQVINSHPKHRVHSTFWDVPTLRDTQRAGIQINTIDARVRGINDGDQVRVFNDRGEAVIPCWVTNRIMPGVVHLDEGNWFLPDEKGIDRGGCPNIFTRSGFTPGTCYPCNTALVQVEKA